jgi:Holliday junction resolvase RusA-like endonuclease
MPSTKGSARAFVVGSRAIVTNDAGKKAKAWAAVVAGAAVDGMDGRPPLDGPLEVTVTFLMPRPKAHSTSKGMLRPNAPAWCSKKPDADKLARCALDALTGVVFVDDAQIAQLVVKKRYANGSAGAGFVVTTL